MSEDLSRPVLIVGAGPTGLVTANLLGLYGIPTLLIEREAEPGNSPRAISIDDEGLRICQALGLRQEILAHVLLNMEAQYLSRQRLLVRVTPASQTYGYPLISTFYQPGLEAVLLAGLQRFPHVRVCFGHALENFEQTEHEVQASIRAPDGKLLQIHCAYLLACDGGKSAIRRALNIALRGTTFRQRWLVVDGYCDEQAPERRITFFCDPYRPAVSVPAPGKGWRWEFMLLPGEDERAFLSLSDLAPLLEQIGETRRPHITRQAIYTFHATYASSFSTGRIFLLGDAAHLLPPFGGQGMNCGLRDAHNLSWKLALVLRKLAAPGLLATYQQERAPHARQMIRLSALLGNIVMPTNRFHASLRDGMLRALLKVPPVAVALTEMRVKPALSYRQGFRDSSRNRTGASYAGQLLPQPTLLTQADEPILLDELLGSDFALLRLHANPQEAFSPLQADLWQRLKLRRICIVPAIENTWGNYPNCEYARDTQHFARFLQERQDLFLLVRPDRVLFGAFLASEERPFVAMLQKQLERPAS